MSMLSGIDPRVLERADEIHREFSSNIPFRYVVIDQFLDSEFCRQLIAEFPD